MATIGFSGSFSRAQWEALSAFLRTRAADIPLRIAWLRRRLAMLGAFHSELDHTGAVTTVVALPAGSHLARLVTAYTRLGGSALDLYVRPLTRPRVPASPHGVAPGMDDAPVIRYTDGSEAPVWAPEDAEPALLVRDASAWARSAVKDRREEIEYRARKVVDQADRIVAEIGLLEKVAGVGRGSLEDLLARVTGLVEDPDWPTVGTES